MEDKKISVIMPVYNSELYLDDALESVFNQTYSNFEIVAVNDGSSDNSLCILKEWEKKYKEKMVIINQDNQGQSAARNNALKYVNGEFISFVDSDDILDENMFSILMKNTDEETDISVCAYEKFISETTEVTLVRKPSEWLIDFKGKKHLFQYSPCGKIFRTEFIRKYGFVFSLGEQLEDGPYCCMTDILARKVQVADYVGYKYRIHNTSTMGNIRKGKKEPKMPFNGIETATTKVLENTDDVLTRQVLEYTIIKILTGLTTNMYKSIDNKSRKKLVKFCYEFVNNYFPNVGENPFIHFATPKGLPLTHRVAVKLFVISYKLHILYPFSYLVSKVL
ncbi:MULTISPECIES: glycosyltransferase family A protein [unclassified Breznakia]|uniref:glycosyltransferase family 2 protein n=1 Tax=unclassified Breznakia TaxID=2623764 RepID=UPI002474014F|nr:MULTISPECIES: glycosyltransferase family A protein [unclassified Breznakia]MDH6367892.1 glycosyltransferase EpsH [Breznakia sp. PH1-1]MDH6404980.1 glycosyltransferase EpsH [Breznakia sp. PF1-11]MDH6412709.1 glycosyltransferase EpsH [Breznakia sp. PFB1-11]MDH6415055.1 glycosyltransferase EpsH [Breznakia sp. PFB1-14]MDH6417366.1 glycosyltransferase EpsH [Breznakia sp. PFB1-4]